MSETVLTQRQSSSRQNPLGQGGPLREGYTTGSCAAAAAAGAAHWLKTGEVLLFVELHTPAGKCLTLAVLPQGNTGDSACFGVVKDSGDDPDITNGALVMASVRLLSGQEAGEANAQGGIVYVAGKGVGTVTKAGLKVPVGEPAINPVPRTMIQKEIRNCLGNTPVEVTVSVMGGENLAIRTFNSRLGIEGGLSILGTTGIVRPMSEQAILDTIAAELSMKAAASLDQVLLTFGAMGERELTLRGYDPERMVQASNFIGFALDEAARLGFKRALIAGHGGKLVKIAAGVFNTHSAVADARMETLCAFAALEGASIELLNEIMNCVTTDAVTEILLSAGLAQSVWKRVETAAAQRAARRSGMEITALVLDAAIKTGGV